MTACSAARCIKRLERVDLESLTSMMVALVYFKILFKLFLRLFVI